MRYVLNENFTKSVISREGPAAKAHMNVGTGHAPFLTFEEPYDVVEMDSYRIDAHLTVAFRTPAGKETEVLLERLWLIAAFYRLCRLLITFDLVYPMNVPSS